MINMHFQTTFYISFKMKVRVLSHALSPQALVRLLLQEYTKLSRNRFFGGSFYSFPALSFLRFFFCESLSSNKGYLRHFWRISK